MTHFLTAEGKKQLEEKLNYYKATRRGEASEKIAIAREFGDLSENSEYDAAKEEQAQIEAEIREMEDILLNCKIIDKPTNEGEVSIGSTVTDYDEEFDENEITWCQIYLYDIVNLQSILIVDDETA